MPSPEVVTNFKDSGGVDLGKKLITKDYLISVYPQIANQLITPELWTWGNNQYGGRGTNETGGSKVIPVTTLAGGSNWKQVEQGGTGASATPSGFDSPSACIKNDGTLWTWGSNWGGVLGTNNTTNRNTPVTTFIGGTNWKQVSIGWQSMSAIKTDGTLWIWGYGTSGQLGNNTVTNKSTPVTTFIGGTNWKQVSCGYYHTAAIKTDGTLWTWGLNTAGQLGTNNTTARSTPVTTFIGGTNWKQVDCGGTMTACIKTDGTLWTWGNNVIGSLGINNTTTRSTPVTTFIGGTNWKQVSVGFMEYSTGYSVVSAIKTDGTLWVWGQNNAFGSIGALGINTGTNRSTPVTTFAGGTNWKQVSASSFGCVAIKTDGTLWTWGENANGQLGTNNTTTRSTPVTTFAGGTNWKQVAGGMRSAAAIKTSDDLIGI